MRFDDTLETVLSGDLTSAQAAQSAWRQLVDLIGRGRAIADARAMATLRAIQPKVPESVRASSARALEYAHPPAPLVRLFALDELQIALPVLRSARLTSSEWVQLLPDLAPGARAVLRNRQDLGPSVKRALESFGPIDFVLPDQSTPLTEIAGQAMQQIVEVAPAAPVRASSDASPSPDIPEDASVQSRHAATDLSAFVQSEAGEGVEAKPLADGDGPFEIADVVARIDAFWRDREEAGTPERRQLRADDLRFETDATGTIRWVEGVNRTPVIGVTLAFQESAGTSGVDGVASGAFRRRAAFSTARMVVEGNSDAAGDWLISAVPIFDPVTGRFTGYRGVGRRPRADERADSAGGSTLYGTSADSLRQLVHELRTPTTAIAGFAEMIETQMLGPVAASYRERAREIRSNARELLGAIDDLDLAARIDSAALTLIPGRVAVRPLLAGIVEDLSQLLELRGATITLPTDDLAVDGDGRAVERLLARLMATIVSASGRGERIGVHVALESERLVAISIDRPQALADFPGEAVLGIDDEHEDVTLLGTGFALRLARNLARELGGSMVIEPESLTLRLPAAVTAAVGQATLN